MKHDAESIVEHANKRRGNDGHRLGQYQENRDAYFGDDSGSSEKRGTDSVGRPLLQWGRMREELISRKGAPNLLVPIVDDLKDLRGMVPMMKVIPEGEGKDPEKEAAVKRSRIIRAWWDNSNMDEQQLEAAWMLTTLGDFVYTLTPYLPDESEKEGGMRPPGIYITVEDPAKCFPRFRTGWDRYELDDLFVITVLDADVAEHEYGVEEEGEEHVDAINYYSRDYNCLVVGGRLINEVEHDLGFCPAQWVRNKLVGEGKFAQSDIGPVLDQHRELQVMCLVLADALIESTYSQLVVKDPQNVGEQIVVGPGAPPIVVQASGGVDRIQPANPPSAASMIIDRTWENIQRSTGTSPIRMQQQVQSSNTSGRALHVAQGASETRLNSTQTLIGAAIRKINAKSLLMAHRIPELKKAEMTLYGEDKGKPYSVTFTGEELGGWSRNTVSYGAMLGSGTHEKAVVGLQLHGQGMVPKQWVLESVGIDDPEMLIKEATEEKAAEMHQQMQMQQAMQPGQDPGQQQGQIMAPAEQGQALAGGQMPQNGASPGGGAAQPPPPDAGAGGGGGLPPFPPVDAAPTQPGVGSPTPLPDPLAEIDQVIASVKPQMRGEIVGRAPMPGGVEIVITDYRDKVLLRKAFAGMKVKIDVVKQ